MVWCGMVLCGMVLVGYWLNMRVKLELCPQLVNMSPKKPCSMLTAEIVIKNSGVEMCFKSWINSTRKFRLYSTIKLCWSSALKIAFFNPKFKDWRYN